MANEEHLALLQQGVADLNWADLSGADLSGVALGEVNLFWADLSAANLSRADLTETNLFWADLSRADLTEANLNRAKLSGANLREANLSGANLSGANLSGANLSGANLSGANLSGANLDKANLEAANLSLADLNEANLSEANLNGANLDRANLREAKLDRAFLVKANLSWVGLGRAGLGGADLSGADLSGADLTFATLSEAKLTFTTLSGANLSEANLSKANFCEANFRGANLSKANFGEANLSAASLEKTQCLGTKFNNAILTGICIEDWNTNSATSLDDVICDYVYLRQFQQERRPLMGHFAPQEFTKLFQKALETVDLTFADSIEWHAFAYSFKNLQIDNESAQLDVQSVEKKRNGVLVVRVCVSPDADKTKIHSDFMQTYEFALKVLQEQDWEDLGVADEMDAIQRKTSANNESHINRLFDTIAQQGVVKKVLAKDPRKVFNTERKGFQGDSVVVEAETLQRHQTGGKIQNYTAQQNLADAAAKIQQILEQLSQKYPTSTNAEKLRVVAQAADEIKNNSSLKAQVINALKTAGTEGFKKSIEHPLINILVVALEEAKEAE